MTQQVEYRLLASVVSLFSHRSSAPTLHTLLSLQLLLLYAAAILPGIRRVEATYYLRPESPQRRLLKKAPAPPPPLPPWPPSILTHNLTGPIAIDKTNSPFDGKMVTYFGPGGGSQTEDQPPLFMLANGTELRNVILGSPAGDGVHCYGSCILRNVWWSDVGEDAATLMYTADDSSMVMKVLGGGARFAVDKIFQHNGVGSIEIRDFYAEDFGKLYRACGNCPLPSRTRHVIMHNITIKPPFYELVGLNANWNDTAIVTNVSVLGKRNKTKEPTCGLYIGGTDAIRAPYPGKGMVSPNCLYSDNVDVIYLYGSAQRVKSRGRLSWIVEFLCIMVVFLLINPHQRV